MKKATLYIYLVIMIGLLTGTASGKPSKSSTKQVDSLYLMAYFTGPEQHLFYAYSYDGLNWKDMNGHRPVFDAYDKGIWLRDPYLQRITHNGKSTFHLIHTWGWDHPYIFHWESDDLITWRATNKGMTSRDGLIPVMDGLQGNKNSKNAWAPEFTFDQQTETFYLYWASDDGGGYLRHHYCTTKDWRQFTPSAVYFDPGFTTIDMSILRYNGLWYAFYKDERGGEKKIRMATSRSLDPAIDKFSGTQELFPGYGIEVEGPETFQAIGQNKCFLYWDKFNGDKGISFAVTDDPSSGKWSTVPDSQVVNPSRAKHGSVVIISIDEFKQLQKKYGK